MYIQIRIQTEQGQRVTTVCSRLRVTAKRVTQTWRGLGTLRTSYCKRSFGSRCFLRGCVGQSRQLGLVSLLRNFSLQPLTARFTADDAIHLYTRSCVSRLCSSAPLSRTGTTFDFVPDSCSIRTLSHGGSTQRQRLDGEGNRSGVTIILKKRPRSGRSRGGHLFDSLQVVGRARAVLLVETRSRSLTDCARLLRNRGRQLVRTIQAELPLQYSASGTFRWNRTYRRSKRYLADAGNSLVPDSRGLWTGIDIISRST